MAADPQQVARRLLRSGMSPVVHFELPAKDMGRAREFYQRAFGWRTESMGPEVGDQFALAFTTESDEKRIPRSIGAINGGFYARTKPDEQVKITILVADIREAMNKVEAAGGRVLVGTMDPGEPDELPGVGLFANVLDSEGNLVTIYEDRST